jgi:hypothetical protein
VLVGLAEQSALNGIFWDQPIFLPDVFRKPLADVPGYEL